jgi:hypothetical protein
LTEFPHITVPKEVTDAVASGALTDDSWHNDVSPSFSASNRVLWVGGGMGDTFVVTKHGDDGGYEGDLLGTDDAAEAVAFTLGGSAMNQPQRVFFDGEMRDVGLVAGILADNGRTADYIFRRIGFLLGLLSFEDSRPKDKGYQCDFECIIERMPRKEAR